MKLLCLAIGKRHDASITSAIDDYTKRLQHYTAIAWRILPQAKGKMTIDEAKRVESAVLLAQVADDDYVVVLDEQGLEMSSSELADMLDAPGAQAKRMVYIIGGPYGVNDELKQRADMLWSLSRLTFPHQLVRLLLVEQLYRAHTIQRGEPYHHE